MSVFWKSDHFGYDGDFVHGHVKVNYWQDRAQVEAEVDEQLALIRASVLAEIPRLVGDGDA